MTTDYWIATIDGLPPGVALQSLGGGASMPSQLGGLTGGYMKEFAEKMSLVLKGLPPGMPLKTVTSINVMGPGGPTGMSNTMEISGYKTADVNLDQLVLPEGYTEASMPGMGQLAFPLSADGGAKWRIKPGG